MAAGAWCSSAGHTAPAPTTITPSSCIASQWWHGFSGIKYVFSFGDSYTTTEFKHKQLPYPSPSHPLGNPPYPGRTSANGPNWIDYFTVRYNHSTLQTYNLAYGGATVDSSIVPPYLPSVLSLKGQVLDEFVPGYAERQAPGAPAWAAEETLFAVWMGINDVNGAFAKGPAGPDGTDAINQRVFKEYAELVRTLYGRGARNFVFLNVPAIERSPLTRDQGEEAVRLEGADLAQFNSLIGDMARGLRAEHQDANVWVYDSYADFATVMDNPGAFPQTSGYKNTEDFCDAYQNGTPDPDYFDPACGIRANEYLWSNSLHPTDPVHELVAARVAELLVAGPNIC
ncbi:family 16 carbohydrate esterase [Cryphonectria parasitica EP155]|uniref:Family 16 carbohydrate esterase n=1 Tax=Cryphonectria parasitica (strain ATCC 38755 / EP155) TaxID=660469 RepID=A0A9P4XU90_CRYP1|nr:family 16 carbohydrate esterase [Cryphonectria parasitica EP155]KAF3761392.1 family 16 carbohydrate esterase [Cryphonectria parasitica EP155]